MRKFSVFLIFLIFLLALGFAASEEIENEKTGIDLIFNVTVLNDTLEIHVILPDDATGSVSYTIDAKEQKVNVKNGDAPLNVTDLEPGQYELKANYSGDEKYIDIENRTVITVFKVADDSNSTNNDTNESDLKNDTNNVTNRTDSKNITNNVTNKTNNVTNKTDSKNITNNVTNKTNNVTNKTDSKNVTNNVTNKTDSKNNTNLLNNTTNIVNNVTNKTNNTVVNNNTTVVVTDNQTVNNTTASNEKPVDNIPAVTHNSPKKPKINQNNNPYNIDAKTGIPIALVIIAIAIFIGIKRYDL